MIAELLDLADRLEVETPRPFEPMPVDYFIDLSSEGALLGITSVCGGTNEKTGKPKGKDMDCPAYFSLKIKEGTADEIQATAGGGVSVAEAGHGDVREIFCTEIKAPKGKPPKIATIDPPAGGQVEVPEVDREVVDNDGEEDASDEDADSDTVAKMGKSQYYRHDGWLKRINAFVDSNSGLDAAKALKGFIDAKHRLASPGILDLFSLPDPAKVKTDGTTPEETEKAKDAATKERNAQLKQIAGARFTFRINGQVLLNNQEFNKWWKSAYAGERNRVLKVLPTGADVFSSQDDDGSKRLTPVFPHIPSVPGGGTYCPLASFDKAATRSFGLEKHTLSMSLTTTERVAAALKWLLQDKRSNCTLGKKLVAIFWAVPRVKNAKPCPHDFADLLNEPDALQVLDFFRNIHGHAANAPESADFYCALLSSPKSRITVRSWHTKTLAHVSECAERYFSAVSLPVAFQPGQNTVSPIGDLAAAIVPAKSKSGPTPAAYSTILHTALFGTPLPHSFLESVLSRQSIELAKGYAEKDRAEFESRLRARTAVIKLYFKTNKNIIMNERIHENQNHAAYLCGRVLALLDRIHNEAHGKSTASSPADRYYGSASSTPALVFPRLCKLARIHLVAVGKDTKRSWLAPLLDRDLTGLIAKFNERASWPRTLSLEDQGRFAIGFYYERVPKGGESTTDDNQTNNHSDRT